MMKTTYHTDCVIRSQLGILTPEELQLIPSSTRHNWKHRNLSVIFGLESQKIMLDNIELMKKFLTEKRFSKTAKVLWLVCLTLQQITYQNWSLLSVYYQAMREGGLYCSLGTWYKYAKALGISRPLPCSRRKKRSRGIRARYPGQIPHLDVTIFSLLDHSKIYLYFITDNYSRKILAWYASLKLSADFCMNNLKSCLKKYGLGQREKPTLIITDAGPENSERMIRNYIQESGLNIRLLIAQRDITKSNSKA